MTAKRRTKFLLVMQVQRLTRWHHLHERQSTKRLPGFGAVWATAAVRRRAQELQDLCAAQDLIDLSSWNHPEIHWLGQRHAVHQVHWKQSLTGDLHFELFDEEGLPLGQTATVTPTDLRGSTVGRDGLICWCLSPVQLRATQQVRRAFGQLQAAGLVEASAKFEPPSRDLRGITIELDL